MSTSYPTQHDEVLQNRFGLRVAARLSAGASELPHDVSERLRAARLRALERRKRPAVLAHAAAPARAGASAVLGLAGGDRLGFWGRASTAFMLLALAAGLIIISTVQDDDRVLDVADLDAALLTDDLPPQAYTDPGFVQFLKTQHRERGSAEPVERPET